MYIRDDGLLTNPSLILRCKYKLARLRMLVSDKMWFCRGWNEIDRRIIGNADASWLW